MNIFTLILVTVGLAGNAYGDDIGPAVNALNTRYNQEIDRQNELADQHKIDDGEPYILPELDTKASFDAFAPKACKLTKNFTKAQRAACNKKFELMLGARIREKYPHANQAEVDLKCQGYPIECESKETYESWIRASHNKRIDQIRDSQIAKLDDWYESNKPAAVRADQEGSASARAEQARQAAAWGKAFQIFGRGFEKPADAVIDIRQR